MRLRTPLGKAGINEAAFHRYKALMEAQQKLIDLDAGPTQFRRLVDDLLATERRSEKSTTVAGTS